MDNIPTDFNTLPSHLKVFVRDFGERTLSKYGIRIYKINGREYKQRI